MNNPAAVTPARAREPGVLPGPEERIQVIAQLMLEGEWTNATHAELAQLWGCDPSTVRRSAAEASRGVRSLLGLDPETVRAQCIARLDAAYRVAKKDADAAGMTRATIALAKMAGVAEPSTNRPGDDAKVVKTTPTLTLESILRGPGDIPNPSPAQVAICRAADGLPVSLDDAASRTLFGRVVDGGARPSSVLLVAGVRGGKSRIAACAAVQAALGADLSRASRFEEVRVVVLAPRKSLALLTFRQVLGVLQGMPGRIVGDPSGGRVVVRRDDGRQVSIVVAAASAYGTNVRSGWLAGLLLDEAAFFGDSDDGYAVNVEDIVNAASTRLLGPLWVITSPNGPKGWVRETFDAHRGDGPSCEACGGPCTWLVAYAPTLVLNPTFDQRVIDRLRARDADAAAREFDAAWVDADAQWIPTDWIRRAQVLPGDVPRDKASTYYATMDPATRGNAWTLEIGRLDKAGKLELSATREWVGTKEAPLSPAAVLGEVADLCRAYDCAHRVWSHQAAFDALQDLARQVGVTLSEHQWAAGQARVGVYQYLRELFGADRVAIPAHTGVAADLGNVRRRVTHQGTTIALPVTVDGRHCDHAPSLAMLAQLLRYGALPADPTQPVDEDRARFEPDGDGDPWDEFLA